MAPGNGKGFNVLWATDGSDSSRSAIPLIRRLVLPATQKLTVLSVAPHSLLTGARPDPAFLTRITPAARRRAVLDAEDLAQAAATELDPTSIEVEATSRWGNPIEEVLRVSRSSHADLIVLGAKGHSNLGLILLGSVSQGVVQYSTRPVLIARPGSGEVRSVVIGFDGSAPARGAVAFLDRLGLALDVAFHVVYVVEPFGVPPGTPASYRKQAFAQAQEINKKRDEEAQRSLEALGATLRTSGRKVETEVVHGAAGPELDRVARDRGSDLIVVGSRKPSPSRHYLLGSTAEKLVRHSHASVLIVR